MKDIFFEHLSKLSFIKKNKLIELGFNVDDKQQGKAQIIILYLYLGINALKMIWKNYAVCYYKLKNPNSNENIEKK